MGGLVQNGSLRVDDHVGLEEVYRERQLVQRRQYVYVDSVGGGVYPGRVPTVAARRHPVQSDVHDLLYLCRVHGDLSVKGEDAVEFSSLGEALQGVLQGLYAALRGRGSASHTSEVGVGVKVCRTL